MSTDRTAPATLDETLAGIRRDVSRVETILQRILLAVAALVIAAVVVVAAA